LEDGWGLDIIHWLREWAQERSSLRLPVITVYSAFDDYAHVSAALSLGVKAYITKRRCERELEEAMNSALAGRVSIDSAAQAKLQSVNGLFNILTRREAEILSLVKRGLSNKEIAARLGIKLRTVENILSCVYDKTGIKSRLELQIL
jgi:DNA-binding NarL/FixJ family response regulator